MFNITITQETYNTIKSDVTKLFDRYVKVTGDKVEAQLELKPIPKLPITSLPLHDIVPSVPQAPSFPISQAHVGTGSTSAEVDSAGVPWNPELHSSSKQLTSKGLWRVRRNLDPDVAAKLKTAQPVAPQQPVVAQQPVAPQPVVVAAPLPVQPAPVVAPVSSIPAHVPKGVQAHTLETFKANLVPVFSALIHEGKIDQDYVNTLKKHLEVTELWQLMTDAQKLSELYENFCGMGLITRIV